MAKVNLREEYFPSMQSFLNSLDRKENAHGQKEKESHCRSEKSWDGGFDYRKAIEACLTGVPEVTSTIKKQNLNICQQSTKRKTVNYYYGSKPNVARAVSGIPKDMRQTKRIVQKQKTVHIVYDLSAGSKVTNATLRKAGKTVYDTVVNLEHNGISVKLDILPNLFASRDTNYLAYVTLKDYGQRLVPLKISFPLGCQTSFMRRLAFRWIETTPVVEGYISMYGSPLATNKTDEYIKSVLENSRFYNKKDSYYFNYKTIKNYNFDVQSIINSLEL